jgi:hypothetical protein
VAEGERQQEPVQLVAPGTPGAVECAAAGCGNWFVKNSGRHIYCKAPNCTYRRGAPAQVELREPEGAAAELLRRLQEDEGSGQVGPEAVGPRLRAISEAQRVRDPQALFGAYLDAAAALVNCADLVRAGSLPMVREQPPRAPVGGAPPVGLVQAALRSHLRTVTLAQRRVEAVWAVIGARDAVAAAEAGLAVLVGVEGSVAADELLRQRRREQDSAERALTAVEAAWEERLVSVEELKQAASPGHAAVQRGGGANGTRGRAAA